MGHPAETLPKKPATYDDVLNAPENMIAEIIAGELSLMPRPRPRHARGSSILGGDLTNPFDKGRNGPGGWVILDEPELHLGPNTPPDILVPDLAGWHRDRLTEFPDTAYFTLAPDWACEILSPSTAILDRVKKQPVYLRENVTHLWLISPDQQTLEIFEKQGTHYVVLEIFYGNIKVRAKPFDAIELDLAPLWTL